jgi:hypothetical protein
MRGGGGCPLYPGLAPEHAQRQIPKLGGRRQSLRPPLADRPFSHFHSLMWRIESQDHFIRSDLTQLCIYKSLR